MNRDMYAFMFRYKDDNEWRFSNENIIVSQHEAENHQPEHYLCKTLQEAREVRLIILDRHSSPWPEDHQLAAVKISRMNGYNLRRELEVLEYREWK